MQAANEHSIPVFYVPRGMQTSPKAASAMQAKVDALFTMYPDGLTIPAMKELMKEVCKPCSLDTGYSTSQAANARDTSSRQPWSHQV